jgi:hypothetical protein
MTYQPHQSEDATLKPVAAAQRAPSDSLRLVDALIHAAKAAHAVRDRTDRENVQPCFDAEDAAKRALLDHIAALAAAPASPAVPPRLLDALARRNFRAATDMDDLVAMAANIIVEDGHIIERLQAKLAASPAMPHAATAYRMRRGETSILTEDAALAADMQTRGWEVVALVASSPAAPRTWRHKKRGTTYAEVGLASLQAETPCEETAVLVIYRGDDGRLWARPHDEFHDGRFEAAP